MQAAHSFTSESRLFQDRLTARIQADLPAWYGPQARLLSVPEFRPRPWSFFFRYPVWLSATETSAVLVKVRHAENMDLVQAGTDAKMKNEITDEYNALTKIHLLFDRQEAHSCFFAVRPMALYQDLNALVMEEADISTLRSYAQGPGMWVEGPVRESFRVYLGRAGRWLRLFHDQGGYSEPGPFFDHERFQSACQALTRIEAGWPFSGRSDGRRLLDALYLKYRDSQLPYRIIHHDYSCANIFVTGDGRICSFDPHNLYGPIYVDIAQLIGDLETCRIHMLSQEIGVINAIVKSFAGSFLRGYFGNYPVHQAALLLYRWLFLLEKWGGPESKLIGPDHTAGRLLKQPICSYYARLFRDYTVRLECLLA